MSMTERQGHWICTSVPCARSWEKRAEAASRPSVALATAWCARRQRRRIDEKGYSEKFILVLLAALCINSVIFYLISSHMILKMAREDMTYTIEMIDRLLDYEDESYLAVQIERMEEFTGADDTRVTLIHLDGTVVSDTDTSTEDLDNHLSRKEVKEALLNGMGYAKRYSKTMGKHFLYVAFQSHRSDMILRISVPYSGFSEYLPMLLPAALVSFLAALACAFVFTRRFVDSVTRPLQDIVSELQKVKGGNGELHFRPVRIRS